MGRTVILILAAVLSAAPVRAGGEIVRLYDPGRGGTQGWAAPDGRLDAGPSGLRLVIAGPDASFLGPGGLALDASAIDRCEIDLALAPRDAGAFLYWTDDGARGFVPEWRLPVPAGRSVIRLAGSPYWHGKIDRFLLAPEPGATGAVLRLFEARGPRGAGERFAEGWRRFWATDPHAAFSVNGILAARAGPLPFPLLVGVLAFLLPILLGWPGGRAGRGERIRSRLRAALFAGALILAIRSGVDWARAWRVDDAVYAGKPLAAKLEAANPPGFWRLLHEARDWIPPGEPVEVRAEGPYPLEKAGFYLYPRRVARRARHVLAYRTPAPADSASADEILRIEGSGSLHRRAER